MRKQRLTQSHQTVKAQALEALTLWSNFKIPRLPPCCVIIVTSLILYLPRTIRFAKNLTDFTQSPHISTIHIPHMTEKAETVEEIGGFTSNQRLLI